MPRKVFKPEQIINKLREAEVLLSQGVTVGEVARKLNVTEQTYYRWRKEYGGMQTAQIKRLKDVERENGLLRVSSNHGSFKAGMFSGQPHASGAESKTNLF